jgi:hypothetical protein
MISKLATPHLALTLSLCIFAFACTDDGEGGNDDNKSDETGDGDGDPASGDGDGEPEPGDGDGEPGDGDGDGDGDGEPEPGDGDGEPGDGDGEPGDGDGDTEPSLAEELCADSCTLLAQCGFPIPDCQGLCMDDHNSLEEECKVLDLDAMVCLSDLTCAGLVEFLEDAPGYPCETESQALQDCSAGA